MRVRARARAPAGARAGLIEIATVDRPNRAFGRCYLFASRSLQPDQRAGRAAPVCDQFPWEPANPVHEGGHSLCPLRRSVGRRKVSGGTGGAIGALPRH